MTRDRLGRPVAVTLGLAGLLLGYLLWVLEIDGLHTQPPSVLGALVTAPLWTLFPGAVGALVGYALGTRFGRLGHRSRFEFTVAAVLAVPALPVAVFALSTMFFGIEAKEGSAPTSLLTIAVYPGVLLLATATTAGVGYLFGLGWRGLGAASARRWRAGPRPRRPRRRRPHRNRATPPPGTRHGDGGRGPLAVRAERPRRWKRAVRAAARSHRKRPGHLPTATTARGAPARRVPAPRRPRIHRGPGPPPARLRRRLPIHPGAQVEPEGSGPEPSPGRRRYPLATTT